MVKEVKKSPKKEEKKDMRSNEEIFRVGQEFELDKVMFVVQEIKGVDLILARKDYK